VTLEKFHGDDKLEFMESLRSLLPSLNSLVVFEAAGRLASFTGAAQELRMTQAAVSYAVQRLEEHLGTCRCSCASTAGSG
jgi:hypothetical protein